MRKTVYAAVVARFTEMAQRYSAEAESPDLVYPQFERQCVQIFAQREIALDGGSAPVDATNNELRVIARTVWRRIYGHEMQF